MAAVYDCDGCTEMAAICKRRSLHIRTAYITYEEACSFVGHPRPLVSGHRYGTDHLLLPHARSSSRRRYDPDGPSDDSPLSGVQFVEYLVSAGDPEKVSVDLPSSSLTVTAISGSDGEVVGRRSVRTGETR
ncbi:hypothetical protein EVAR_77595_1 [Eumeta japonica]|uniref:Uncharacterized protein n=1 Tax=Eumeta variegata TaxID=151549 RepID=A0A4C1T6Z9_EUMVA|nr:hypothetical protein EVAR_77595_1 [Eumeta japonica]